MDSISATTINSLTFPKVLPRRSLEPTHTKTSYRGFLGNAYSKCFDYLDFSLLGREVFSSSSGTQNSPARNPAHCIDSPSHRRQCSEAHGIQTRYDRLRVRMLGESFDENSRLRTTVPQISFLRKEMRTGRCLHGCTVRKIEHQPTAGTT